MKLITALCVCIISLGVTSETRTIVYFEPIKMVPLVDGVPAYRGNIAIVKNPGNLFILKYSQFYTPHKFEEDLEKPGMDWFRFGGARRFPIYSTGNGAFYEGGVNAVHWKFDDSFLQYEFTGIQLMGYCGFQYIGKYIFSSASIGVGINAGIHQESKIIDPNNELPPKILSNPPIGLISPYTPVDLELSLGVVF